MGILFVLIFWAVTMTVAAFVAALVLSSWVRRFFRARPGPAPAAALLLALLLPFLAEAYVASAFVVYAVWSYTRGRDMMLGDSAETPLPDGFRLIMIDVPDEATVYKPPAGKSFADGGPIGCTDGQPDCAFGVESMQIAGPWIFATATSHWLTDPVPPPDRYVVFNTKVVTREDFSSLQELYSAANARGVILHLEPVQAIYDRYRTTWADWTYALIVVVVIPLLVLLFLLRRLIRLRNDPEHARLLPGFDWLAARVPGLHSRSVSPDLS